jgi:hypothetical protein
MIRSQRVGEGRMASMRLTVFLGTNGKLPTQERARPGQNGWT